MGLDGGEAMFYVYIQSTTIECPDLERTMEQALPYTKSITWKQDQPNIQVGSGKLDTLQKTFLSGYC